jgi:hypothetical protein
MEKSQTNVFMESPECPGGKETPGGGDAMGHSVPHGAHPSQRTMGVLWKVSPPLDDLGKQNPSQTPPPP